MNNRSEVYRWDYIFKAALKYTVVIFFLQKFRRIINRLFSLNSAKDAKCKMQLGFPFIVHLMYFLNNESLHFFSFLNFPVRIMIPGLCDSAVEHWLRNQEVAGLIPGQDTCIAFGLIPSGGEWLCVQKATDLWSSSLIDGFISLSFLSIKNFSKNILKNNSFHFP